MAGDRAEWVKVEAGYNCIRAPRGMCDIFMEDNVPPDLLPEPGEPPQPRYGGLPHAKITVSEADGSLLLFTDLPVHTKVPCDWTVELAEHVRRACGGRNSECASRAARKYREGGGFDRCSGENLRALHDDMPELFDIPGCKLHEAHGHGDVVDLHYTCTVPKRGDAFAGKVHELLSKAYGRGVADRVAEVAKYRRRAERE